MSQRKTQEDLVGLALLAQDHWKGFRPKLYQSLIKQGILYDHLFDAGERANDYIQGAVNEGMDAFTAKEVALRRWIYLPDMGQEPDLMNDQEQMPD